MAGVVRKLLLAAVPITVGTVYLTQRVIAKKKERTLLEEEVLTPPKYKDLLFIKQDGTKTKAWLMGMKDYQPNKVWSLKGVIYHLNSLA